MMAHHVRAAFVVAASPGGVPDHLDTRMAEEGGRALPFVPAATVRWSPDDGRTVVWCWQEAPGPGLRWLETGEDFVASCGHVRVCGGTWGDGSAELDAVRATVVGSTPGGASEALSGMFALVHLDAAGRGLVLADALGARFLFHGCAADLTSVASDPTLAALVLAPPYARPERDELGVVGLAWSRHHIGERTGFRDVKVLPVGTAARLSGGRVELDHDAAPWLPTDGSADLDADVSAPVDDAAAAITEAVAAAVDYPADVRLVDVTGGMDSRLVVAAAAAAGLTDAFDFRTTGPPHLADVVVGGEVCAHLGVPHRSGFEAPADEPAPYAERVRLFVRATVGLTNVMSLKTPLAPRVRAVSLGGLFGEVYRSSLRSELSSTDEVGALLARRFGALGLLDTEVARQCRAELEAALSRYAGACTSPLQLFDSFGYAEQVRHNFGPREDLGSQPRLHPLSALPAVRASFALGDGARRDAGLHRALLARVDPWLVEHRLTPSGWPGSRPPGAPPERVLGPRQAARRDSLDPAAVRRALSATGGRRPARVRADGENLAQLLDRRAGADERLDVWREVLADRANPVWAVLDRDRTWAALDRHDELTRRERFELAGAVTAALWLGDRSV